MNTPMDPAAAARALDIVAGQRAALSQETRPRWWVWAGLFAYAVGVFALMDFAPDAVSWVTGAVAIGIVLYRTIPGLDRRTMALFGRRAQIDRDAPWITRAVIVTVLVVVMVGMFLLVMADVPAGLHLPPWMAEHVLTFEGLLFAIVITPLAWYADKTLRNQSTRAGR